MKSFFATFILIAFSCAPTARAANSGSVSGYLTDAQDTCAWSKGSSDGHLRCKND